MSDPPFVRVRQLTKYHDSSSIPILKDVSFDVQKGQICSIIGRSGAGKSTVLRCLNGLESFQSGSVQIGTLALDPYGGRKQRSLLQKIGTVFQTFNLLSRRTVLENILLPAQWAGMPFNQAKKKAMELAEKTGLGGKVSQYPRQLSGGQCQRVAIARALITDTQLLLCDELTSALDPETSLDILSLLRQLNQEMGVTILLVTHDMSVVREISHEVIVMEKGILVEQGDVEDLLLNPFHEVTKTLVRGLFLKQLPKDILNQLTPIPQKGRIFIQLVFSRKSSRAPIIADLIRSYDMEVNIVSGSLDHLKEVSLGILTISMPYEKEKLIQALHHFKIHSVSAEILGYWGVAKQ